MFRSDAGDTIGRVIEKSTFDLMSLSRIARLYDESDLPKMKELHISDPYQTYSDAFHHHFGSAAKPSFLIKKPDVVYFNDHNAEPEPEPEPAAG